jgi:hypothetical protein
MDSKDTPTNSAAKTDGSADITPSRLDTFTAAAQDSWDEKNWMISTKFGTSVEDFDKMCKQIKIFTSNDESRKVNLDAELLPNKHVYVRELTEDQVREIKEKFASIVDLIMPNKTDYF